MSSTPEVDLIDPIFAFNVIMRSEEVRSRITLCSLIFGEGARLQGIHEESREVIKFFKLHHEDIEKEYTKYKGTRPMNDIISDNDNYAMFDLYENYTKHMVKDNTRLFVETRKNFIDNSIRTPFRWSTYILYTLYTWISSKLLQYDNNYYVQNEDILETFLNDLERAINMSEREQILFIENKYVIISDIMENINTIIRRMHINLLNAAQPGFINEKNYPWLIKSYKQLNNFNVRFTPEFKGELEQLFDECIKPIYKKRGNDKPPPDLLYTITIANPIKVGNALNAHRRKIAEGARGSIAYQRDREQNLRKLAEETLVIKRATKEETERAQQLLDNEKTTRYAVAKSLQKISQ